MGTQAASSLVVDFDVGREIVLVCTTALAPEVRNLAQELLAAGFETSVAAGIDDQPGAAMEMIAQVRQPGLVVAIYRDQEIDIEALEARVLAATELPHEWLDGRIDERPAELSGKIAARLDEMERADEHVVFEPFDVDEVSNVVLLPRTQEEDATAPMAAESPTAGAPPAAPRRRGRDLALGGAIGMLVSAVASLAVVQLQDAPDRFVEPAGRSSWPVAAASAPTGADRNDAAPVAAPAAPTAPAEPTAPPQPAAPPQPVAPAAPVAPPQPAAPDEPAAAAPIADEPSPLAEPAPAKAPERSEGLDRAVRAGKIAPHDGLLVTAAQAGQRTWFQAMTLCRARSFGELRGWRVPSRAELSRLARARALPDETLWSSTRTDRSGTGAYTIHGRTAAAAKNDKTETTGSTICVRRDPSHEDAE